MLATLVRLAVLSYIAVQTSAETFYITPNSSTSCLEDDIPCFTLSEFAYKPNRNNFLASNTTLILLLGTHYLESELYIEGIEHLTILANNRGLATSTNVTCKKSGAFTFNFINQINIIGIDFFDCANNNYVSIVDKLKIERCNFNRIVNEGITMSLQSVQEAHIFISNFFGKQYEGHSDDLNGVIAINRTTMIITNSCFKNIKTEHGSAIATWNSNVTIHNSTFVHNKGKIGGVMNHKNSTVKVHNCTFINNTAMQGGVMKHETSKVSITNSIFTYNRASIYGSIMIQIHSTSDIHFSIFDNNKANKMGGVMLNIHSTVLTYNCIFTNNSAMQGGVMVYFNCNGKILGSIFTSNTGEHGGVMLCLHSNNAILNTTFISNTANRLGGVMMIYENSSVTIQNSKFNSNTAMQGGVMDHENSNVSINGSFFTRNAASQLGGIMYNLNGSITINYSTFVGNTATEGGVMNHKNSKVTLNDNIFINNKASKTGGVMLNKNSNVTIQLCKFTNNAAVQDDRKANENNDNNTSTSASSTQGGVMYHKDSDVKICNSTFTRNIGGQGGAMIHINSKVIILDVILSNNLAETSGAMYHLICSVVICNSIFANNTARKGGGGAMLNENCNVTIHNTTFINNNAHTIGGAMLHMTCNVTIYNSNLTKNGNKAHESYGGAFFIISTTLKTYGYLTIANNTGSGDGTVLHVTQSTLILAGITTITNNDGTLYISTSNITFTGQTNITNNFQTNIQLRSGGVLSGFQSVVIFIGETNINYNEATCVNTFGGAIALLESKLYTYGKTTITKNVAIYGGGIHSYQSELNFEGETIIARNIALRGGGIHASSSTIKLLPGSHQFIKNYAQEGGGLFLELNAKVYILVKQDKNFTAFYRDYKSQTCSCTDPSLRQIKQITSTEFKENYAQYGGGIFVSDYRMCVTEESQSECFLQILADYIIDPKDNQNINNFLHVKFTNNSAGNRGSALYGGLLDRCLLNPFSELFYQTNTSIRFTMSYFSIITNLQQQTVIKSKVSSHPVRVCFCLKNFPNCTYHLPTIHTRKGQKFVVSLVAVDQVNNTISDSSIHSFVSPQAGLGEGQSIQKTSDDCTELEYTIMSPHASENITVFSEGPCKDSGISASIFQVVFRACPVGFVDTNSKCDCDPKLFKYITNCSIDTQSVLRRNNSWISHINTSSNQGYLTHKYCPFDYCHPSTKTVWINLNTPKGADAQCAYNRSGKICGSCNAELSLTLGSSHCQVCSNSWLVLLIVFAIAGIALVAFLHLLKLTVDAGTSNALIFYSNVIFSNRTIFLPFQREFQTPWAVFIAWLNLDLGFKTCFYDGMDAYVKTWLQLAFPAYIILMVVMVIIVSEYSAKLTYIISWRRNPISTLATLILLSYTKILRTIIAALVYARLEYPDGSFETVWLIDANMRYFETKHILLVVVAALILIVGLVFTSLILFWQCLQKCPNKKAVRLFTYGKLYSFMDVYLAPYNVNHRYYMGILLLARVILYIVSAITSHLDPSYTLLTIITVSTSLLVLQLPLRIFKHWPHKILETMFLVNLILLAAGTWYVRMAGGSQAILSIISITVAFVVFVAILLYHGYSILLQKRCKSYYNLKYDTDPQLQLSNSSLPVDNTGPTYSEIDACPPIEDTDIEEETSQQLLADKTPSDRDKTNKSSPAATDIQTANNEIIVPSDSNTNEECSMSYHKPTFDTPPSRDKTTQSTPTINNIELVQNEMDIELQTFAHNDTNNLETVASEEPENDHEDYGDETTPLLAQV